MGSVSSAVLVIAAFLLQSPGRHDHEAGAALALAKAKAANVKRVMANVPVPTPEKCDGTCCDDVEAARKLALAKKMPIVLYVGTGPKPSEVKALGDRLVLCKVREYETDLDPKDVPVYKATPRVWLLVPKPDGSAFTLAVRWAPAEYSAEKVLAELQRPPAPR